MREQSARTSIVTWLILSRSVAVSMAPTGKAYHIDWIFSNNSDVHVAKHLDWFDTFTPFVTKFSTGFSGDDGKPAYVNVTGIGDVILPVETDAKGSGHDTQKTLKLRNVLYAPSGICNILGYPRNGGWQWQIHKLTDVRTGAVVGLLDYAILYRLRLTGHSPNETSLTNDSHYFIRANWPQSERKRWEAHKTQLSHNNSSTTKTNVDVLVKSGQKPYTAEEKRWLKENFENEFYFLRTYGYSIYDEEGRADGRRLVRAFMQDDSLERLKLTEDAEAETKPKETKPAESGKPASSANKGKSSKRKAMHDAHQPGPSNVVFGTASASPIPTLYDETHRGIWHYNPHVASMGNYTALIGHLEHHAETTDGSFGICIAGGEGNYIDRELYESIPQQYRPALEEQERHIGSMMGGDLIAIGTIFIPIILKNAYTGKRFRIVLYAYVLPKVVTGMFISYTTWIKWYSSGDKCLECDFGNGEAVRVNKQV